MGLSAKLWLVQIFAVLLYSNGILLWGTSFIYNDLNELENKGMGTDNELIPIKKDTDLEDNPFIIEVQNSILDKKEVQKNIVDLKNFN